MYYRLRQRDFDGSEHFSQIVDVALHSPQSIELFDPYPNPSTGATEIRFSLPVQMHCTLIVYDMLGAEVARSFDGVMETGMHSVAFNTDRLAAGNYTIVLQAKGKTSVKNIIVLK